jgi:hypothetical protein
VSWHADPGLLRGYATGAVDEPQAASLEAHLLGCPACRGTLAAQVPAAALDRVWEGISSAVDRPRAGPVERALVGLGVPDHVGRLLGATRSLRLSWFGAVGIALAFAVASARFGGGGLVLFLTVAPLLPLAGVAVAYGPGVDPTYEIGLAAPMRSFRLLLIRAAAVLVTSTGLAALASLALPRLDWTAVAWLLPSLALTATGLALSSFWPPLRACGLVGVAWVVALVAIEATSPTSLAPFRGGAQTGFAAILVLAGLVLVRRRESFERRRIA